MHILSQYLTEVFFPPINITVGNCK